MGANEKLINEKASSTLLNLVRNNPAIATTAAIGASVLIAYTLYARSRKGDSIEIQPDGTVKIKPEHTGIAITKDVIAPEGNKTIAVATNPKAETVNVQVPKGSSVTIAIDPATDIAKLELIERLAANPKSK